MAKYDQAEWDAKIEAAAKRKDRKEVERLMLAQQDAFLEAFPFPDFTGLDAAIAELAKPL